MDGFTKEELQLFKATCRLSPLALKDSVISILKKFGYTPAVSENAIMAEGDIPIALVAHLDTVFPTPITEIFYDADECVAWGVGGLGSDDRAGVLMILQIIKMGYKPHLIFTCDEETGATGAAYVAEQKPFSNLRYIIELDRSNTNDCVFYHCDNKDFIEYIKSYGFIEAYGTFTDISIICPMWDIAGTNLSIGYMNEHTPMERLYTKSYKSTLKKVISMLDTPPINTFEYIPAKLEFHRCGICGKTYSDYELIPVAKDNDFELVCIDCCVEEKVGWCSKCGKAIRGLDTKNLCRDCRKVINYDRSDRNRVKS